MGLMNMGELAGLGQVDILAALVGPLAEAGVTAFGIHEGAKLSEKQRKQQRDQFNALLEQREKELGILSEQRRAESQLAAQQGVLGKFASSQNVALAVAALALIGVSAAVFSGLGRRRRGS